MNKIYVVVGLFAVLFAYGEARQSWNNKEDSSCSAGICLQEIPKFFVSEIPSGNTSQIGIPDDKDSDSVQALTEEFNRVVETLLDDGGTIGHGIDTTLSPCDDHYQFVNNGWRSIAKIPESKNPEEQLITYFSYATVKLHKRLAFVLDSAKNVHSSTTNGTLKALGTFYASCLKSDTLEYQALRRSRKLANKADSTREQECVSRTLQFLGPATGQLFAEELKSSGAITRMESLTASLKKASIDRLKKNTILDSDEKENALERLGKLGFRVGIPDKLVDYSKLTLSRDDYFSNKVSIAMFDQAQWIGAIGESAREQWKQSLLRANASYHPGDHAIEISALLFYPPFFYAKGDDILNYAGVGYIIGHEVFHSIAQQLPAVKDPAMKLEMDSLKTFVTTLGKLDGWEANGRMTFSEDVADLGGARIAYAAWKEASGKNKKSGQMSSSGYTPDQQFFIAIARVWRGKWTTFGIRKGGPHSPGFVRANAIAMQNPEFRKAFGCKPGDRMYLDDEKISKIW